MSTEYAMIVSAAIAVGASLFTLLITRIFDARSEKRKEREHFFYEVFPKRLELYEEIIKVTNNICDKEEPPQFKSKQELQDFYLEECDTLADLIYRSNIFGSVRVIGALVLLRESQEKIGKLVSGLPEPLDQEAVRICFKSCIPRSVGIKNSLLEFIREESGVYMINKKTDEFLRNVIKKKKFYKKNAKGS